MASGARFSMIMPWPQRCWTACSITRTRSTLKATATVSKRNVRPDCWRKQQRLRVRPSRRKGKEARKQNEERLPPQVRKFQPPQSGDFSVDFDTKWLDDPDEEDSCQIFTRANPIPNGIANIMWCSCPSGGGKLSSDKHVVIGGRFSTR